MNRFKIAVATLILITSTGCSEEPSPEPPAAVGAADYTALAADVATVRTELAALTEQVTQLAALTEQMTRLATSATSTEQATQLAALTDQANELVAAVEALKARGAVALGEQEAVSPVALRLDESAWGRLKAGMSEEQVRELLGRPSRTVSNDERQARGQQQDTPDLQEAAGRTPGAGEPVPIDDQIIWHYEYDGGRNGWVTFDHRVDCYRAGELAGTWSRAVDWRRP